MGYYFSIFSLYSEFVVSILDFCFSISHIILSLMQVCLFPSYFSIFNLTSFCQIFCIILFNSIYQFFRNLFLFPSDFLLYYLDNICLICSNRSVNFSIMLFRFVIKFCSFGDSSCSEFLNQQDKYSQFPFRKFVQGGKMSA